MSIMTHTHPTTWLVGLLWAAAAWLLLLYTHSHAPLQLAALVVARARVEVAERKLEIAGVVDGDDDVDAHLLLKVSR